MSKVKYKLGTPEHERETRRRLLAMAKAKGYYEDLKRKLDYWDSMIQNCTNERERADMTKLANIDVFSLYDQKTGLAIDGEVVIPAEEGYTGEE